MRGWDKVAQRSIDQPYILVLQVLTLGGLSVVGERSVLEDTLFGVCPARASPVPIWAFGLFQKLTTSNSGCSSIWP